MPISFRSITTVVCCLLLLALPASTFEQSEARPPLTSVTPIESTDTWKPEELQRDPNIIIVLSEAFWDAAKLPNVSFSRDPIPFFRALSEYYPSGTMLSPMYGGGTANVEMEVLTGKSYRFYPEDSIVYESIQQPTGSLAHILAKQGYATTAITAYHQWFVNSSQVYKHLGFSRYISYEYFNPDEFVGPYIGDHAVASRIMEQSRLTPGADFIFASTMENHYHFFPGKFKRNTIEVEGSLPKDARGILETYAQGSSGADAMLQELVTHYSTLKEPTILVWFGDHMPHLEKDYLVYRAAKYITGEEDPDFLEKMHRVPVLVWSNYMKLPKEELNLSPSFLGPYVLKMAKRTGSAFTEFLSSVYPRLPVLPPASYYDAYQVDKQLAEEYKRRQAAELEAEELHAAGISDAVDYVHGYEQVIEKLSPAEVMLGQPVRSESGRPQLVVHGARFGLASTLFLDNKPLKTTWQSEGTLTAELPKDALQKPGDHPVQIKVIDTQKTVIRESNIVPLKVVATR
jgi:hypothetical protein